MSITFTKYTKEKFLFPEDKGQNTDLEVKTMNIIQSIWKIKNKIQNLATNELAGELY